MGRYIILNSENVVMSTRTGNSIVEGEIKSDLGECGQVLQMDGTFITLATAPVVEKPSLEAQLAELKEQNLILMDAVATLCEMIAGGTPV